MKHKYTVFAITENDDEIAEVAALGLTITTTDGSQDETEFEVELTEAQAEALKAHPAVFRITKL